MRRHVCAYLAPASERAKQGDGDAPLRVCFVSCSGS
jgi:hypothetical protein